ncbi:hypothetical protein CYMTET_44541 [Cymbomonas tetramitiformis]|uniref:Uncharacterized protein n=1 Tax=Cymbomonas tetramitiformis TaxID=36881 RepID=A0AAE0C1U8_9CHLO|nr:hypothetical protein CYMTET_44541 [Cymbomonas tetramitiformis]
MESPGLAGCDVLAEPADGISDSHRSRSKKHIRRTVSSLFGASNLGFMHGTQDGTAADGDAAEGTTRETAVTSAGPEGRHLDQSDRLGASEKGSADHDKRDQENGGDGDDYSQRHRGPGKLRIGCAFDRTEEKLKERAIRFSMCQGNVKKIYKDDSGDWCVLRHGEELVSATSRSIGNLHTFNMTFGKTQTPRKSPTHPLRVESDWWYREDGKIQLSQPPQGDARRLQINNAPKLRKVPRSSSRVSLTNLCAAPWLTAGEAEAMEKLPHSNPAQKPLNQTPRRSREPRDEPPRDGVLYELETGREDNRTVQYTVKDGTMWLGTDPEDARGSVNTPQGRAVVSPHTNTSPVSRLTMRSCHSLQQLQFSDSQLVPGDHADYDADSELHREDTLSTTLVGTTPRAPLCEVIPQEESREAALSHCVLRRKLRASLLSEPQGPKASPHFPKPRCVCLRLLPVSFRNPPSLSRACFAPPIPSPPPSRVNRSALSLSAALPGGPRATQAEALPGALISRPRGDPPPCPAPPSHLAKAAQGLESYGAAREALATSELILATAVLA